MTEALLICNSPQCLSETPEGPLSQVTVTFISFTESSVSILKSMLCVCV